MAAPSGMPTASPAATPMTGPSHARRRFGFTVLPPPEVRRAADEEGGEKAEWARPGVGLAWLGGYQRPSDACHHPSPCGLSLIVPPSASLGRPPSDGGERGRQPGEVHPQDKTAEATDTTGNLTAL